MAELDDLLAGIRANPDDDARRLILADWLLEHDQEERAEFVRLQTQLSHWIPDIDERERLQAREQELLEQHGQEWLGKLATRTKMFSRFERGLIHVVHRTTLLVPNERWIERIRSVPPVETDPTPVEIQPNERRFVNSLGMWFQLIPAGTFRMGAKPQSPNYSDDERERVVTISRPYALGTFQVTVQQYDALGANRIRSDQMPEEQPNHPVSNISWNEAVEYCRLLSELPAEKKAGRRYRLPTEAEWELACRAGTTTQYNFGDIPDPVFMNGGQAYQRVLPVGCFDPNGFGLYDMHGQVREWCQDWYIVDLSRQPKIDPWGPKRAGGRGNVKVMRGGSWDTTSPVYCRSAYRVYHEPNSGLRGIGFRVLCELPEPPAKRA